MSRFLPLAVMAVFVLAFAFAVFSGRDPQRLTSPLIGRTLPEFSLSVLEGDGRLTNGSVAGAAPAVINFFASWCLPCRVEQPALARLAEQEGIAVFGISWKDDPAASRAFLEETGNPFKGTGIDRAGGLGLDFGISGVPETFVVGRDGRVVYRHAGPLTDRDVQDVILPLIEKERSR